MQKEAANWEIVKKSEMLAQSTTQELSELLEITTLEKEIQEQEFHKNNQDLEQENLNKTRKIEECILEINQLKEHYSINNADLMNALNKTNYLTEENTRVIY